MKQCIYILDLLLIKLRLLPCAVGTLVLVGVTVFPIPPSEASELQYRYDKDIGVFRTQARAQLCWHKTNEVRTATLIYYTSNLRL